ncbi:Predicted arabinose efflux permease, MFS family [Novosphingobium sp. CF614]|uniref:MFS transporter n=1 Tax=Novosphingobium sp. CF614 TaxID=1884364 RepID=UPI0008E396D1|nr:MFS transporter [Novosphingobium sp. CF614]SFG44237.1 Predicted arabinose efflux permease, MFS family [Novosphingobium sp. CF614]
MAGHASPVMPEEIAGPAGERRWSSAPAAYWALFVIVLATFITFFDQVVFGMLAERIKHDFGLTDSQLGFLAGPASIVCYLFVGIPLARLADIYPRKYVLAGGVTAIGTIIAMGGLAQNFLQFVMSRVFLAAGGSAHAPSSYSLLADAFPPRKLTRAFALLQFGFIGGTTLGPWIGGKLVMMTAGWEPSHFGALRMFGWQWILVWTGLPALLVALLFLTIREPQRLIPATDGVRPPQHAGAGRRILTFMGFDAFKAIHAKPRVFYPLFGALALSAVDVFGLQFWRVPFMIRTYGWNEAQIGAMLGLVALVGSLTGLVVGATFVEWLAKRYRDANVRAASIFFAIVTVTNIVSPLMPTGESALVVLGFGLVFGLAGAVPQNAAVQRIAPNAMRGQVTAIYLFMFTFFGAMGAFFVGLIQDFIVGDPHKLWLTLTISAATLLIPATILMYKAIRPYREEIERLEALETVPE